MIPFSARALATSKPVPQGAANSIEEYESVAEVQ